jgi:hypothetical protein
MNNYLTRSPPALDEGLVRDPLGVPFAAHRADQRRRLAPLGGQGPHLEIGRVRVEHQVDREVVVTSPISAASLPAASATGTPAQPPSG